MSSDTRQSDTSREERKKTYERTLSVIRQQTYDGKPLAARTEVCQIISRSSINLEQADKALRAAIGQEEVFNWHGQLCVVDEESLVRVLEWEAAKDNPRPAIVAKCNRLLKQVRNNDN